MHQSAADNHGLPSRSVLESSSLARWLAPTSQSRIEMIDVGQVDHRPELLPHDDAPTDIDDAITASISTRGVVEPLLLRPLTGGRFEVVQGARRFRAARRAGLLAVPAVVRDLSAVEAVLAGSWQSLLRRGLALAETPWVERRLRSVGLAPEEIHSLIRVIPTLAPPMPTGRTPLGRTLLALGTWGSDAERVHAPLRSVTKPGFGGLAPIPPDSPLIPVLTRQSPERTARRGSIGSGSWTPPASPQAPLPDRRDRRTDAPRL